MDPKHEQTTNEAASPRKRALKPEKTPQAEIKVNTPEDDVLDVIEGVESQLGALRQAHEDHRRAMKKLAKDKREMESQVGELEARETELTTREVELAEMRQDFESREMNLIQRAGGLEQRESKLATHAEVLEQQEAELESKDKTLEVKINELDSQLAGISKRKAELIEIEGQVKEKLAQENDAAEKLASAEIELEKIRAQVVDMDGQMSSVNTELEEHRASHQVAIDELASLKSDHEFAVGNLKATESKLRGKEIELAERSHAIEELAEKTGGLEHDLSTSRDQYGQQLTQVTEQLDSEQQLVEQLRAQIVEIESHRDQAKEDSSGLVDQIGEQLKAATDELELMRHSAGELSAQGQQSEGQISNLTRELRESQDQVKALAAQINEIAGSADEELTAERNRVGELESTIAKLNQQVEQAASAQESLQAQFEAKPEADPQELLDLQSQIKAAKSTSETSQLELNELGSVLEKLKSEIATRDEQIAIGDAKVQELVSQSDKLFETIEELNAKLEEAQALPSIEVDSWNQDRRARLQKMRRILSGDAEKIRLATNALRSRYDQCEQVLSKRAELAEAYEAIESAQRKYQGREVRSGVFLGLIGIAAITMVLAATSWLVSDRIMPGVYAAKVTMAAASGDSQISEAEMDQWELYITQLATDPRFLEVAADRMKRRGIAEFAVPGDLAREMEHSLDVASAMPGTIVMEYRGEGAARTQRVLDTFAVALSSAANNARARRADSSLTVIEEEAIAGAEPLDSKRIEMAGMIFGGGVLLTIIIGGVLWKRLSASKAKFEDDSRVDGLLDESRWQMPGSSSSM